MVGAALETDSQLFCLVARQGRTPKPKTLVLHEACPNPTKPYPPAMENRCVCTTGTAQSTAEVQSKGQRIKLFSDMS